ncbi:tRNA (adenine(58)-N(1))-methyltransferase non-catalytic subunit TRM6 [Cimex lectularius]|uniref:tRNA (adenine(58)-N(1))-methyltransferase non-catalytic subunit TRM6 n=1 Tax=Cimex lectularius TaxID=79782 RepID=A0A8I6S779_CIMLE|nr:tRNA (adenine(58)-N(1))-methyltransferase non-catalytic subunit TRM6 [Cimex lectularius]
MNVNGDFKEENKIKIGDYVIIQRQGFFKLHQLSLKTSLTLGKDKVDLKAIVGKRYWSVFKMLPIKGKREYELEETNELMSIPESVMKEVTSGTDNRNITDTGKSQLLSTEDIEGLRDSGLSARNIVGKLIENSTTFKDKTEYSQEKYLKKKEKKYYEYIIVRKPTLRLICDIFYNRDQFKMLGLRYDTLGQILTLANIQSNGNYILFENGTQAIVGASILNCLGPGGNLINLSIGNHPQKQAILGLNFTKEQLERFISVKITDFTKAFQNECPQGENSTLVAEDEISEHGPTKRKITEEDALEPAVKKPRWMEDFTKCVDLVKEKNLDGLIIVCKEYPLNILLKLLRFVKPSRQIVVYSIYREALVELYVELKKRKDVLALHIYENWLRTYQVLTDRTHPDVTMSSNGGHLLVATKVLP